MGITALLGPVNPFGKSSIPSGGARAGSLNYWPRVGQTVYGSSTNSGVNGAGLPSRGVWGLVALLCDSG